MLRNGKYLTAMAVLVCGMILMGAGLAFAKGPHQHHAGPQLLGSKINTDGKHELHEVAGHTVHAHVSNKKITKVTVTGPKGEVPVKRYRSSKKMAALGDSAHQFIVKVSARESPKRHRTTSAMPSRIR